MKKTIITLSFILVTCIGAFGQTLLKVSTADKQAINVALDGRYFNKRGTSVTVGDLPPGRHILNIYGVIKKRNGKLKEAVIYEGPVQTRSGMITLFVYDPATTGFTVHEEDLNEYLKNNKLPAGAPTDISTQGGNYDNANNSNNAGNNDYANSNENGNDNNDNAPVASPVTIENPSTLTEAKTAEIKKLVDAKKTDTDKMKMLKESLQNEKIITDDVAALMDLFNFESTKLDFVKWAYTGVLDKENYSMLDAKFTYKNYQDEFLKFVQDHK